MKSGGEGIQVPLGDIISLSLDSGVRKYMFKGKRATHDIYKMIVS